MRTSTVVIGLLFGAVLAATLVPPLLVLVPARVLGDWWYVTHNAAMGSLLAALGVPIVAGFFAALFVSGQDVGRAGTSAGLLTTLVGGVAVALPAAGVHAYGELLAMVGLGRADAGAVREAAGAAMVSAMWIPAATAAALLVLGPIFGAIGGVGYDLWQGSSSRATRQVHRSSVPLVTLYVGVAALAVTSLWTAHLDVTLLPALGTGGGWWQRVLITTPMLVSGLLAAAMVAWALRDTVLLLRSGARLFGTTWGALTLGAPALMALVSAAIHPMAWTTPSPWLATGIVFVAGVGSLIGARGNDSELHERPRGLTDLLGEGLLMGLLVVAVFVFVGGTSVAASMVVASPYVSAALGRATEVAVRPETVVWRLFTSHWLALVLVVPIASAYTVLAVPIWLVVRALFARERAG